MRPVFSEAAHEIQREVVNKKSKARELVYQASKNPKLFRMLIEKHGIEKITYFLADVERGKEISSFKSYLLAGLEAAERLADEKAADD